MNGGRSIRNRVRCHVSAFTDLLFGRRQIEKRERNRSGIDRKERGQPLTQIDLEQWKICIHIKMRGWVFCWPVGGVGRPLDALRRTKAGTR
ncbi:hypothetical protein CDAR_448801 [Caerostris darwini]|uniref:Uncharacterized protein n=1 Tax=Caerostris darwini TaxID=1538125 RepID=A0AAV4QP14_9ARAC|nr:hypothetical protein CDAR_448801 [Caerostris darwini]